MVLKQYYMQFNKGNLVEIMTEAERIYQDGWLPEEFWKESTNNNYTVSANMKKVWAIELDLYREFARVCNENNLVYFTDGGTTLGAVRHKGFIPWDDDFDVCMPRNSYEKLKNLSKIFNKPYFLQNAYTDPEYGYSFMRLRNENTTADTSKFMDCQFNHGIFIDIFPLDKVLINDYLPRRERIQELIMINSSYMKRNLTNMSEKDKELMQKYYNSSIEPVHIFEEIERIAMQDELLETEYLSLIVSTQYDPSKKIWPKWIFDDYIEKDFESIKVRVPIGYDEQLRIYFGNYMEYPPEHQRGNWHNMRFYPDIPYKQFYHEKTI